MIELLSEKSRGFMLDASNCRPERALRPPPVQSALPTQFIFVSA